MTKTGKDTVVLIGNHYIVIYNFRKELIQSLIRQGYRVVVLLPCTEEAEKIRELGCELVAGNESAQGWKAFLDIQENIEKNSPVMRFDLYDKAQYLRGICVPPVENSLCVYGNGAGKRN